MTLEVKRLSARYGGTTVVREVSLDLPAGQVLALIGANGVGKSTLLRSIAGLHRWVSGSVVTNGRQIIGLPAHRIAGFGVGLVPEGRHLFGDLTVRQNLEVGLHGLGCRGAEANRRIEEVIELFPVLGDFSGRRAGALSGGQQQMLAIGRALVRRPRVLLLDEPSLGLAPLLVTQILQKVRGLAEEGVAVLLAEQNAAAALRMSDVGAVMENGRLTRLAPAVELLSDAEVSRHYLGGGAPSAAPGLSGLRLPDELRSPTLWQG